jgi:hypothetical protein
MVLVATANLYIIRSQNNAWGKYESTEYGFSVEYPQNWGIDFPKDYSFDDERRTKTGIVTLSSPVIWDGDQPNAGSVSICSRPVESVLNDFAKGYCGRRDDHLSDIAKDKTVSRKLIIIDGVKAEKTVTKATYEELHIYYVSFVAKGRKFFIKGQFHKSQNKVWDTFKYEPEFDKIVGSLQLLDEGEK